MTARAVRRSLLIFCEGEVTEEEYLNFYRRLHRATVTIELGDFHGTPLPLVEAAVAEKEKNEKMERRGKGAAHSEVWCVFDTDQHPYLNEAVALAHTNGVKVAISCPCIELWFLLHFVDQQAYIERAAVQREARSVMGCGKHLSTPALEQMADQSEAAKSRARGLDEKHRGDGTPAPGNPSSGVWQLVDAIQNL